jgi:transcriptional regulator with XRE-family HTH domain
VTEPALSFAGLLRQLRAEARLTQEELAEAASLSPRSVSDLERGINRTAHKNTALLLADALGLEGPVHGLFVAAARSRASAADVLAARQGMEPGAFAAAATRALPRDTASFTGRGAEFTQLLGTLAAAAASGGVVGIHAIDGMAGIGNSIFALPFTSLRTNAHSPAHRRRLSSSADRLVHGDHDYPGRADPCGVQVRGATL